jgi:hypothetical protein
MLKGPIGSMVAAKASRARGAIAETYEEDKERRGKNARETNANAANATDRPFTVLDSGANYVVPGSAGHFVQISCVSVPMSFADGQKSTKARVGLLRENNFRFSKALYHGSVPNGVILVSTYLLQGLNMSMHLSEFNSDPSNAHDSLLGIERGIVFVNRLPKVELAFSSSQTPSCRESSKSNNGGLQGLVYQADAKQAESAATKK